MIRRRPSDATLEASANKFGIPVFQPARINTLESVATLRRLAPDLLLSIAYDQILARVARDGARLGAVNIHAGKLPAYRGRNVLNWVLINGEQEIGITAHFMDDGIDTG